MRLESTGVLKGFMIFLMATDAPVSWSFAELNESCGWVLGKKKDVARGVPYEAKCTFGRAQWWAAWDEMDEKDDAPMPTGWRSTYLVVTWGRE